MSSPLVQRPVNRPRPRNVVLGVSGGIAAYKSAELVRRIRGTGAEVRVVMTKAAHAFITPLTLQALSGHPVRDTLLDPAAEAGMDHIELARWADLVLVAPASADLMARLATGLADDLLTTLALATAAPLVLAPAMNHRMWLHPATQASAERLRARGVRLLGPDAGEQACGETGPGRMLEPEDIVSLLLAPADCALSGRCVMVTAGPTREAIDPVRYIGNRSSGRMGYAVARAMAERGADVVLISGPAALTPPAEVALVRVETALEMEAAVMARIGACDVFVSTAAVADYRVDDPSPEKLKKERASLSLKLVRNPDILARVAALPKGPFTVGFAAETHAVEELARGKLETKGLDIIAANRVGGPQGGFERDDNALIVLWADGRKVLPMMPKARLAAALTALIEERYAARLTDEGAG